MPRNTAFFMHQRAVQIVQQRRGDGAASGPPFSFTDPTFNDGGVYVIIDDGSGGKFVGGNFTSVTCNVTSTTYTTGYERLVHLLPTGEVDAAWSCPANVNQVDALALDVANDRLFVGGSFTTIGGESRSRLALVEASSGIVDTGWTCNTNGAVYPLALDVANDRLFVGGSFTSIGGESRAALALVEASSGTVDTLWTCSTNNFQSVRALALDVANDRLFVGGSFTTIGGESRADLALVEASSGIVDTGWTCNTNGQVWALALDVANDRLFVGGAFSTIGGESRADLALVEASSGIVDAGWTCSTTSGQLYELALDVANDRLFVGGSFTTIGGESRAALALVEASSGTVDTGWTCDANSIVLALLSDPTNDALFVGGFFSGATGLDGQQRDRFGTVVASTGDLFVP